MDLVPRSTNLRSAATGYRDQNAALARDLAPIAQITGKALAPRTMQGDFLSLDIDRTNLVAVCRFLRDQLGFDLLSCISGVDMLDHLETVYHVWSTMRGQLLQLKVRLDHEEPEVDSVVSVWPTANWLERETYDMFGIKFAGHPDLRRMLLDDDFEGIAVHGDHIDLGVARDVDNAHVATALIGDVRNRPRRGERHFRRYRADRDRGREGLRWQVGTCELTGRAQRDVGDAGGGDGSAIGLAAERDTIAKNHGVTDHESRLIRESLIPGLNERRARATGRACQSRGGHGGGGRVRRAPRNWQVANRVAGGRQDRRPESHGVILEDGGVGW